MLVTKDIPKGVLNMTFHFREFPANFLTNTAKGPLSKMPELKYCAVSVEKVSSSDKVCFPDKTPLKVAPKIGGYSMVNVGDKFYACAADESIKGECGGAATAMLKFMLEDGIVDGVVAMRKGKDTYDGVPELYTDTSKVVEAAGSLHCAPLLQSKYVFKYLKGAKDSKLAVVGMGCGVMVIQKMAQKGALNLENLVLIGLNCGGTLHPVKAQEMI